MPSPYSSIDASIEGSSGTTEIQWLGRIRRKSAGADFSWFTRSREKIY